MTALTPVYLSTANVLLLDLCIERMIQLEEDNPFLAGAERRAVYALERALELATDQYRWGENSTDIIEAAYSHLENDTPIQSRES
jgi:hypothetical protein